MSCMSIYNFLNSASILRMSWFVVVTNSNANPLLVFITSFVYFVMFVSGHNTTYYSLCLPICQYTYG